MSQRARATRPKARFIDVELRQVRLTLGASQVLRQVERGWNPNAEVELPVAVLIPEAQSREVDAATPAVHTPRHAVVDARSASFEGALPVLPAPAPDTDVRPEVSGPPQG